MNQTIILGHFILAGIAHIEETKHFSWKLITTDTPVKLIRERYNPHDPLAISVQTETDQPNEIQIAITLNLTPTPQPQKTSKK